MSDTLFSTLDLPESLFKAIEAMGFETATPVQAQSIPLIRAGADVIAKSQTGTGKTVAFGIPALERIDTHESKTTVQVLILCPTRELAQQAGEEIRKLAKFMPGVRPAEIFGGSDMERQFIRLRRANMVIGTPGRVMDHMRRGTLKLEHLKMVVLDEADEMLNMGFKEDIETILQDAPEERQTVLFSATMPPAILALTHQFQKDPQTVEIDKGQVTIERIDQSFVDVPQARKNDALTLLLRFHQPRRALVFCNTKRMVDELAELLNQRGFAAEGIHGDLSQSQRTTVMGNFKRGKLSILVATDVAARGIDVSGLDYVFNYDIPMTTEYYVHRIGRTGRAGQAGKAITICCGKRQMHVMRGIAHAVKSDIRQDDLPTPQALQAQEWERNLALVEAALGGQPEVGYLSMVDTLKERGHAPEQVAAALLALRFPKVEPIVIETERRKPARVDDRAPEPRGKKRTAPITSYTDLLFDVGASNQVSPNHLVGAITELSGISGKEIGKIHIYQEQSVVGVPSDVAEEVLVAMKGCKIRGKLTRSELLAQVPEGREMRAHKPVRVNLAGQAMKKKRILSADPVRRKAT